MKIQVLASVLVVFAAIEGVVVSAEPAISWDGSGAIFFSDHDGPFVNGFEFRAESNITVTALGAFDYLGDGLVTPHRVGIWPAEGGPLIVEATVPSGVSAPLLGQFRYASIPGTWLSAGSNYVIAASDYYGEVNDIYAWGVSVESFSTAQAITFGGEWEVMSVPGGLEFPVYANNAQNVINPGANFQFVSGALLRIESDPSGVKLNWATNGGFRLEFANSLPAAVWTGVANIPVIISGRASVQLTNDPGGQQYFRLSGQ
jgi:hypothetical protein